MEKRCVKRPWTLGGWSDRLGWATAFLEQWISIQSDTANTLIADVEMRVSMGRKEGLSPYCRPLVLSRPLVSCRRPRHVGRSSKAAHMAGSEPWETLCPASSFNLEGLLRARVQTGDGQMESEAGPVYWRFCPATPPAASIAMPIPIFLQPLGQPEIVHLTPVASPSSTVDITYLYARLSFRREKQPRASRESCTYQLSKLIYKQPEPLLSRSYTCPPATLDESRVGHMEK